MWQKLLSDPRNCALRQRQVSLFIAIRERLCAVLYETAHITPINPRGWHVIAVMQEELCKLRATTSGLESSLHRTESHLTEKTAAAMRLIVEMQFQVCTHASCQLYQAQR